MKRIRFVILDMTLVGGIERVVSVLSRALVEQGFGVDIVSIFGKNQKHFYSLHTEVRVVYLSNKEYRFGSLKEKALSHLNLFCIMFRFLKEFRDDGLLIGVSTNVNFYLGILARKKSLVVASEHAQYFAFGRFARALRIASYRFGVRKVVSLNRTDTQLYQKWHRDVVCIPNPVNVQPLCADLTSSPRVLAMGRLESVKGFDRLLRIFSKIFSETNGLRLSIVGEGQEGNNLRRMAEVADGRENIEFFPFTKDVSLHFRRAGIFALTSYQECFPMVLLEAMSAGLVPVCFDCPSGPRDIIDHGVNGFLVSNDDERAFGEAILRLVGDHELRAHMSASARARALQYEPRLIAARWVNEVFRMGREVT